MYRTLNIGNSYEFNNRLLFEMYDSELLTSRKPSFAASSELALFWNGDNSIVLTLQPIHPKHLADVCSILNFTNIVNIAPSEPTGKLCEDIVLSTGAIDEIESLLKNSPQIIVHPWGATPQVYEFMRQLRGKLIGTGFDQVFPSEHKYWTSVVFDSKIGGRSLMSSLTRQLPEFAVPEAFVVQSLEEATQIIQDLYPDVELVLKADHGDGNKQVVVFKRDLMPTDLTPIWATIRNAYDSDLRWKTNPLIIERYVPHSNADQSSALHICFDGCISTDGQIVARGVGSFKEDPYYDGTELGLGVITSDLHFAVRKVGIEVGYKMAEYGYCGWYNVDLIADTKNNLLFGLEINARSSGETHVINVAEHMYGKDWYEKAAFISQENLPVNQMIRDYDDVQPIIHRMNSEFNPLGSGIIPVLTRSLKIPSPYFGYMIYGPNIQVARNLRDTLERALN